MRGGSLSRSSFASLASFCLWAKILAYSAVALRFFSARLRLSARRCLLRCNMIGVTRRWTFGAAYFCFLPSLRGRGRLITYWHTLSSFDKLNNFPILDARFGPRRRGMVLSVSPGISPSPFFTIATERKRVDHLQCIHEQICVFALLSFL